MKNAFFFHRFRNTIPPPRTNFDDFFNAMLAVFQVWFLVFPYVFITYIFIFFIIISTKQVQHKISRWKFSSMCQCTHNMMSFQIYDVICLDNYRWRLECSYVWRCYRTWRSAVRKRISFFSLFCGCDGAGKLYLFILTINDDMVNNDETQTVLKVEKTSLMQYWASRT